MTYEEARAVISKRICYLLLGCMDGECKHTDKSPCAVQMAIDALQEKADKEKEQKRFVDKAREWDKVE